MMRLTPFVFLLLLLAAPVCAQEPRYTAFTVNDGLPSNYIYRCIEDNKGFLWVATDAGLARFDGKHFQVFTTRNGLPDNEVLAVIKEKNGRIWANCFKQSPAYFDEVQNKFVKAKTDKTLIEAGEGTGVMYCFPEGDGGAMFFNAKGSFIFKGDTLISFHKGKRGDGFFIRSNSDGSYLTFGTHGMPGSKDHVSEIYQVNGNVYLDSVAISADRSTAFNLPGYTDGKFYLFKGDYDTCIVCSDFSTHPLRFKVNKIKTPEKFYNFEFTSGNFYVMGYSGKLYLYKNNKLDMTVNGDYLANSIYIDGRGDLWVCTIDKGLLLYKKKQFGSIKMPDGFVNTDFLSIARKNDGTILAGNFYGEVVESKGGNTVIKKIPKKGLLARQRKILFSQNKIFTFSEAGVFVNYTRQIKSILPYSYSYGKTAINYNDSIILIGQSTALQKLNTITEKAKLLRVKGKRVTALAKDTGGLVYFGSTDGLYKYSYNRGTFVIVGQNVALLRERVMALCSTPDNLLWVATSGNGVLIVKSDKVLVHLTEKDGIINNASRSITTGRPGQVWVGTSGGISIIDYKLRQNQLTYHIQNLSVNDGLTNNIINEMLYQNDTVYAATSGGVSVIPANVSIPKFNIPVQLSRMSINQRDTTLKMAYKLGHDQRNIQMEFAGIEISGHFKNLQYTLDKNKYWANLDGNVLTTQLSEGKHMVQVRAVDVNGNISDKVLTLKFDIDIPFWKSMWFWLIIAILLQLIIIYLVNRRQRKRKEAKLAKEIAGVQTASLEQQAFTSLMNPHFIFNALNSIQHYINVQDRQNANRYLSDFASLIRKNFEAAQQSFTPLEQEIENIKIYLRLEQMRFNERFSYQVIIDENLDIEDWMIPTMILQPLLENALLHGIMPSSIPGKVVIGFEGKNGNLLITITDNGIGIENSRLLNAASSHKSRGMQLIKKRITALSRFGDRAITIEIMPAFDDEKNPGNKVILSVPEGLYAAWHSIQHKQ